MMNIKKIFFITALIILILTVSTAVSAANDTTNDPIISESSTTHVEPTITQKTVNKKTIKNNKQINKTIKENVKTATKTVEVNNYDELTTTINNATKDAENDEYIINLNPGTYQITKNALLNSGTYKPNIIINANNQTLSSSKTTLYTRFNNGCNITINDAIITQKIQNYANNITISNSNITDTITNQYQNLNLTIINTYINSTITNKGNIIVSGTSHLNNTITNNGNLIIGEDVIIGEKFALSGSGNSISNNTYVLPYLPVYNGTFTLENIVISTSKTNYGNLTLINSTITGSINNYGNLTIKNSECNSLITVYSNSTLTLNNDTLYKSISNNEGSVVIISDDTIFGENFALQQIEGVIINNTDKLTPYLANYNGTYILANMEIKNPKINYGNLTIRNSTLNSTIFNYGNLTICDDVIIGENCIIGQFGPIIINDTSRITPYIRTFNDTYTVENCIINYQITNYGTITFRNVTLNNLGIMQSHQNHGILIFENSTLDSGITGSDGTLIITDDNIIGETFYIYGGNVITNLTSVIASLKTYNGNYVIENTTLTGDKTNNGNLTILNSTVNIGSGSFANNGQLTFQNSTVNGYIYNYETLNLTDSTMNGTIMNSGTLILKDVELGSRFSLSGDGIVITDNETMSKIFRYLPAIYGEYTVELGGYTKAVNNYGNLTIVNSDISNQANTVTNNANSQLTLINTTIYNKVINNGILELKNNSRLTYEIENNGVLIISDDSTITGEISGNGEVIIDDPQRIANYLSVYNGNIELTDFSIRKNKINNGNLKLNNCTIQSTISNYGQITIDDTTQFQGNGRIAGTGLIITNNITKILPYIDCIGGNYTITDTTLDKTYNFNGNVTLNNCTITYPDNSNHGTLYLNNCTVNVGEENYFLDNLGTVYVDKNTKITGQIENVGGEVIYEPTYEPKTLIVTNRTAKFYFDFDINGKLTATVNPGDTLDFQGTISGIPNLKRLCIDKPVNIISSTHDAVIDLNTTNGDLSGANPGNTFSITKDGAYTNITGITFHNTQLWLYNTDHVILDNISAIVEDQKVGSGVGQTSIRANSTYITVKNSYFYTRNNGGSSTLVLAWGDYCTLVNNTVVGVGNVGNLIYLTTYNVEIPRNITYNSHNIIANNTLRGPETAAAICWGIVLSGTDNLVDGNILYFNGSGVNVQWGSGSGDGEGEGLFNISGNTISNNKFYGVCGINGGDIIFNNYIENGEIKVSNALAYNNTATSLQIADGNSEVRDNIINGDVTAIKDEITSAFLANNTINGNIEIGSRVSNITFIENNITGTVTLDGSNNTFINNRIISTDEYTITSKRSCKNNTIQDNYLLAADKGGDASVNLRDESNKIENNIPITTDIQTAAAKEVTVNTSTPITIILTAEDKLLTGQEVTITTNNGNETITLTNGVTVYNYTPTSTGEENITITYPGLDDYMAKTVTVTLSVTPDKDAIIEELTQNNTLLENKLDETNNKLDQLNNTNKNLTSQLETANNKINNLTQANNDLTKQIADTNKKLDQLNNTNKNLTSQLETANNKINNLTQANNALTKQLADTNKKLDDLAKLVENLNKQLQENQKQINNLNKTITEKDNQIKELTTKKNTKITVNKINTTKYGNDVTVTGTLTDASGAVLANMPVSVKINNAESKVVTNSKGTYTLTKTTTTVGTNNVTVSFAATDKYNQATGKATFKVDKQNTKITVNKISNAKYKDTVTITGTLTDANSKVLASTEVSLKINNKTVKVKTGKDGLFTYTTTASTMGTNNVTATYNGNAKYNKATGKASFKVNKQDLVLTVDRVSSSVMYKDNIEISGKLVDGNAKAIGNTQVSIKVNSKTYKAKTDKNGVYVLKLRATEMDTNNVTVSYAGNTKYNKATAKTTFKVSKQDLIIGFNSVTYSNGKVTVSGTFTDRNRHALMNSLTKVTINGKTGNAKTDTNGTFTYTTSAKAGKIKLTLAYPGNARYNAYSKTTTLTIA